MWHIWEHVRLYSITASALGVHGGGDRTYCTATPALGERREEGEGMGGRSKRRGGKKERKRRK